MDKLVQPSQAAVISESTELWYKPGKFCSEFHSASERIRALVGARGCISGDTIIFDPVDKTFLTVRERKNLGRSFHVYSLTPEGVQICRAEPPFVKGRDLIYRVVFESGKAISCTVDHKFLGESGWLPLSQFSVGQLVASSDNPLVTTSDISPLTSHEDGPRLTEKFRDCLENCSLYSRPDGVRSQTEVDNDLASSLQLIDALARIHCEWCRDGLQPLPTNTHLCPESDHPSRNNFDPSSEPLVDKLDLFVRLPDAAESQEQSCVSEPILRNNQNGQPFLSKCDPSQQVVEAPSRLSDVEFSLKYCSRWERILSITATDNQEFYDLHVPGSENYWAEGIWHHNSGKTSTVAMEAVRHCLHNAGAKVLVLRKTEISQTDTTIDTFNLPYNNMGDLFVHTPTSLFRSWRGGLTVRIPSIVAIQKYNEFLDKNPSKQDIEAWLDGEADRWCSWIEFRGLPDATKTQGKLRGYECSMAILVEADLMTRQDYELLIPCIRWKDAFGKHIESGGVVIDTNPPAPSHWIAKLEEDSKDNPNVKFWHIPTEQNQHNLPPGYVENLKQLYKKNPAMLKRMVYGEYAEAFDGSPVFYAFSDSDHAYENLPFPIGAYLVRGWDFGVTNAVVWSAYWEHEQDEYWWVLRDLYLEDSDTDRQCRRALDITNEEFPFWNDRSVCSGVLDFCDPAGTARKDTGSSSIEIMSSYNIFPGYRTKKRTLQRTIAICNRLFERKDEKGNFVFRVDKLCAPKVYSACLGGYRYPNVGEAGYGHDEPLKGPAGGGYDHPADALRYSILNCMRLAKMDVEEKKPNVGVLETRIAVNPPRRPY